ncbi:MAG: hypothetical protein CMJ64_28870 [Planctomycetaceae bacterium]|nr:hypothetical protein [Planctomycetaceae bacterium]
MSLSMMLALVLGSVIGASKADAAAVEPWEYSPYRVQVWLTAGPSAELNGPILDRLSQSLTTQIESSVGAAWRAEVLSPPPELRTLILHDYNLLTPEVLEEKAPDVFKLDKLILLTIETNQREYIVDAREFDCRVRLYGSGVRRIVRQPTYLDCACFQAVSKAFRAVTRIEAGAPKSGEVRIRAGGLVLSDTSPCYIGKEDILLPILRSNDRAGNVVKVIPIEWTYLVVKQRTDLNPYLMECRVWSGKPNPLQGRVSSRKERYALKMRPTGTTSVLRVEAQVKKDQTPYPMAGLEVYAKLPLENPPKEKPPAAAPADAEPEGKENAAKSEASASAEGAEASAPAEPAKEKAPADPEPAPAVEARPNPPVLVGVTDWRGMLTIEPGEMRLRILYLKNGGQLLARLPVIPGLHEEEVARVPDDGPRLQAEGFVKGLQSQLEDVAAQRQIINRRFKMRLEEGKVVEANALYEEYQQLPSKEQLSKQLDVQMSIVPDPPPNRVVKLRIDLLYANLREALGKYLTSTQGNDMLRELNDAKRGRPPTTSSPAE